MKQLCIELEKILDQNRGLALAGVRTGNSLQVGQPFLIADQAQVALRQNLLWTERRLRRLKDRVSKRSARVASCLARFPERRTQTQAHLDLVRCRESALLIQRNILRQIGDTIAWSILLREPRVIAPLYAPRSNQVSTGVGLGGVVKLQADIHATRRFTAIDADLTRCLGIGDLIIVPNGRPWRMPLAVEIKSKGILELGANVEISAVAAIGRDSETAQAFAELADLLGLREDNTPTKSPRAQRQVEELLQRAELLDAASRIVVQEPASPMSLQVQLINDLMREALHEGRALRIVGTDVAYVAIRSVGDDDARASASLLIEQLKARGFDEECRHMSSDDFQENDDFAPLILPIALWPFDEQVRVALLSRDLMLVAILRKQMWSRAFASAGLEMNEVAGEWRISSPMGSASFPPFDVERLTVGVAFAGVSPNEVARLVAESLVESA